MKEENSQNNAVGSAMKFIGPLLMNSMQESQRITNDLSKINIQSSFRDGFEAGLAEGMKRQGIYTREALGIYQKELKFNAAGFYLQILIKQKQYPYDSFVESDIRKD